MNRRGPHLPGYYRQVTKLMAGVSESERRTLIAILQRVNEGLPAFIA